MDHTFFLFLELSAFAIFFYGIERDNWHGLLIFLSTALFLALSLASFNIEKTDILYNSTSGAIEAFTVSQYDEALGWLNTVLGLLSGSIGIIKTFYFMHSSEGDF